MRGTGRFEVAVASITFKNNQPFSIVFFGDVHYGTPSHATEIFNDFCDQYRTRPNTYFVGMGDYIDMFSGKERITWRTAQFHESTEETMEGFQTKLIAEFAEKIKFMRGRLLGKIEGNHHIRFPDGTTTAMRLCHDLGSAYLGDCGILRVNLNGNNAKETSVRMPLTIALHHGVGGGRTMGSMFNSLEHMANSFEGADIYAMGDNHQRGGIPDSKLRFSMVGGEPTIKQRTIWLLRTGSFQRGYVPGRASYVVDKNMRPTNLGVVRVDVTVKRHDEHYSTFRDLVLECVA